MVEGKGRGVSEDEKVVIHITQRFEGTNLDAIMRAMKEMEMQRERKEKKAEFRDFIDGIRTTKHKRKKR